MATLLQRRRNIEQHSRPFNHARSAQRVVNLATQRVAVIGNCVGPIQRIVEAAPPCVGGIQRVTSIGQGDNKLWACDVCEFIVHIVSADSKIVRLGQQISDLA